MREVGILEAKTGLSGLVADVERTGEAVVLTRHGRAAAKIVPIDHSSKVDSRDRAETVREILARRDSRPVLSDWEQLSWDVLKRIARNEDRHD